MSVPQPGISLDQVDTPALLVDLDAFERNLRRMADFARTAGVGLRPHAKAHKSPVVAHQQRALGAIGITCAKLGEAEVLVDAGVDQILISSEVVGRLKIERLVALAGRTELLVVVDDAANARDISAAMAAAGRAVGVLVEVDVGQARCGVAPGAPAGELATVIAALPGLTFRGLQGYEGNLQHVYKADERRARCDASMAHLLASRRAVEERGLACAIVSTAGTGTCAFAVAHPGITEIQPGSYIFMDTDYGAVEGVQYEHALSVLTTVISRQRPGAAIVDAGLKSLSTDSGVPRVKGGMGLTYTPAGDEHGTLRVEGAGALPPLGGRVELLPSHCDTTVNLHDRFICRRAGVVAAIWPIAARGRVQ